MTTFVDTSAIYALLDEDDGNHRRASDWLAGPGRDPNELLVTHAYVVVESAALVHRRLGEAAARVLLDALIPALSILFVDELLHRNAESAYIAGLRKTSPSLVDWVSFTMMRDRAIDRAFAFDRDFAVQGFETVP